MSESGALPAHLQALGFNRNPFPQTPDADCYFRTEQIAQHSMEAYHCLKAGKGFVLLTGEVGTGKSTFLRCLMDELHADDCAVSFVFNTFLQGRNLLLALNKDFGIPAGADLSEDIELLNQFLIAQYAEGRCCVLVIDDAQNLELDSLELLRLLSSLETRQNKLLQIVLSGQPELIDVLAKNEVRQLASRIIQHIQLWPFTRNECERYVNFRISRAGTDGRISLTPAANFALHWHSKGNPRRIHTIMDRCLYGVAPVMQQQIGWRLISLGAREGGMIRKPQRLMQPVMMSVVGVVAMVAIWLSLSRGESGAIDVQAKKIDVPVTVSAQKTSAEVTKDTKVYAQPAAIVSAGNIEKKNSVMKCLQQFGAEPLFNDLENGLDILKRRQVIQSLSKSGLTLAFLPAGLRLPESLADKNAKECSSAGNVGAWVLWRPNTMPFELNRKTDSKKITWLQTQLAANRLYAASVDGLYGPQTLVALNAFQRWHGLPADSNVDAWTLFLLEHDIGKLSS